MRRGVERQQAHSNGRVSLAERTEGQFAHDPSRTKLATGHTSSQNGQSPPHTFLRATAQREPEVQTLLGHLCVEMPLND